MKLFKNLLVSSVIAASVTCFAQQIPQEAATSTLPEGISFYSFNNNNYKKLSQSPLLQKAKSCTQGNYGTFFGELREKTLENGNKEMILVIAGETSAAKYADVNDYAILSLDSEGRILPEGTMGPQTLRDGTMEIKRNGRAGQFHNIHISFSGGGKVKSLKIRAKMVVSLGSLISPFANLRVDCQF